MATIITRSSALAVKQEVTEATPVVPTGATDFVALQDDFAMSPSFDVLESAELKSSIGKSKPVLGLENPTASMSHYLRNSGTGGTAPNYSLLLKSLFGSVDDAGVEHNTVASSTTAIVKVDTGEGATYQKGQALLIKDSTNGYSIRPVESISGNDLTLGFVLSNAPGTGVNLGEAVTYIPTSSGHPTLTLWHYLGNGGAVQMMSGGRVVSASMTFEAGEYINASYELEGVGYYFNPIVITSANKYLDFNDGGGEENAVIAEGVYKDPHALAAALQTAMDDLTTDTITVVYSDSTGKFTIASNGATLTLLWNTGANTANTIGATIGFSVAADDSAALTYTSDNALTLSASYTPTYDNADPLVAKDNECFIGDTTDNVCFCASSVTVSIDNTKVDRLCVCEETGKAGSLITERTVTVEVTAELSQYDADKFARFRQGTDTKFMYNFGTKSGGNWVAGKCGCLYVSSATITSFEVADADGIAIVNMTLQGYINASGHNEVYLSFV